MEEQLLAKVATTDGLKEWYCRFCLETHVWWTSRSVGGVQQTFRQFLQGESKQAVSTKIGESWSESSSSGECEDKVLAHKAQRATQAELRGLRDKIKWYEGERRKQWAQGESAGRTEENEKMNVDEEVDSKKKFGSPRERERAGSTIAKQQ